MFQNLLESSHNSDRILVLTEQTWIDYEKLIADNEDFRISYFNRVISILSPSRNHERIAQTISILINAYCRKYQIPYFALGSKDIKKQFIAGKQPDASYCFYTEKEFPDLAVEVNFTSGSLNDLEKYKLLGIPEVWVWQDNFITFYCLTDDGYQRQLKSQNFYNPDLALNHALDSDFLNQYAFRGLTEDNLTIETYFFDALSNH